jgi:predicted ATPase
VLAELLEAAPGCTMLVTSRSLLRIRAERDVPLLPLALPPAASRATQASGEARIGAAVGTAAALAMAPQPVGAATAVARPSSDRPPGGWSDRDLGLEEYSAVRLFLQRAREVRPDLQLTAATAATIAAICRALDGLPLAIELAAARLRVLPLEAILARLDDRLGLLTMGARDLPERQRTMRGTIEWSHALLEPDQQHLFAALAVFVGPARLEDIETVGGDEQHDPLSGLDALVDQSLVQASDVAGEPRFGMLATIHEFAAERLEALPDAPAIHTRHARLLLALAEDAEREYRGPRQAEYLERLEVAHDELRAALGWALSHDRPLAASLAGALSRFWLIHGHLEEGRNWLRQALARASDDEPLSDAVRAKALAGSGMLTILEGTYDAAQADLDDALGLFRGLNDAAGAANVLNLMGIVAILRDDATTAERRYEEAIEAYRAAGEQRGLFAALSNLGSLHTQRDDYRGAAALAEDGLQVSRQLGDTTGVAGALSELGWATLYAGDPERARAQFRESLELGRGLDDRLRIADDLDGLARVAAATGDPLRGARLWGAAARLIEELGNTPLTSDQRARYERAVADARQTAGTEPFEAAWEAGRALALRSAIEEALA